MQAFDDQNTALKDVDSRKERFLANYNSATSSMPKVIQPNCRSNAKAFTKEFSNKPDKHSRGKPITSIIRHSLKTFRYTYTWCFTQNRVFEMKTYYLHKRTKSKF